MDDLISRQAAIDALASMYCKSDEDGYVWIIRRDAWKRIDALPPAEPKRGKWIKTARWGRVYYCDQCRNYLDFDGVNAGRGSTNFCPNCGADMRTAEQIVHDAIDNTPMAEDAYPGIKERLHKAVDDMREVTNGN